MNATTQFINVMAEPRRATDQVKRDRWGRYLLPHPDTGKEQTWTRATTIANTLADRYGLEQWAKRNVALGIGARQDLYAQAAAAKAEDKDTLTRIVEQAEEAASSKAGANLGSALHRFTERIDNGETITVPEPWAADTTAYTQAMQANGITIVPGWLERILLVPEIDTAGTCDRLCNGMWTLPRIGDLKTGQDVVRYGMTEIALQLAIYAHATHWYDPVAKELHAMPKVDQERAMVMHLPVGQARCTIYNVDIAAGWDAVRLAIDVRNWRKRKDLASIVNVPSAGHSWDGSEPTRTESSEDAEQAYLDLLDRTEWVRDRVEAIKAAGGDARTALAILWSTQPGIPTFPKGGPVSDVQVSIVAEWCDRIEAQYEIPFGVSDPTIPKQTKSMKRETA